MFRDAFATENFKLARNRTLLFWAFGFVPLLSIVPTLLAEVLVGGRTPALPPVSLDQQTLRAMADAASPLTALFCLLGAAVIFGGDYRWETWRLLATRNSRTNLLLGKALTYGAACAATLLLIGIGGVAGGLLGAVLQGRSASFALPAADLTLRLGGLFAVALLQLLKIGGLAALAAVVARSMMPAVFFPILASVALLLVQQRFLPEDVAEPEVWRLLAFPDLSSDLLRAALMPQAGVQTLSTPVLLGASASLLAWTLIGFAVAAAVLSRQDLSKE